MFGLPSREALSSRQSRWATGIDKDVRTFPAQNALNSESLSESNSMNEIISISNKTKNIEKLSKAVFELSERYKNLEKKYDSLKSVIASSMDQSARLEKQISQRKTEVNDIYARINKELPDIYARLSVAESSINELSVKDNSINANSDDDYENYTESPLSECFGSDGICIVNSSEFSTLTDDDITEYVPYYIKESYNDECNRCILDGNRMKFIVRINGLYTEEPIIYPFADSKNIPKYMDLKINLEFTDATNIVKGYAYGDFQLNDDGIYIIKITDIYSDGESSELDKFILPLTITCDAKLVPE